MTGFPAGLLMSVDAQGLRPGDTLVITTASPGTAAQQQALAASLEAELPGVHVVVVTRATGMAVYRGASPAQEDSSAPAEDSTPPEDGAKDAAPAEDSSPPEDGAPTSKDGG